MNELDHDDIPRISESLNHFCILGDAPHFGTTTSSGLNVEGLSRRIVVGGGKEELQSLVNKMSKEKEMADDKNVALRLVKVFIVDPDVNVPLDKRLVYKDEEKLTDLNNQELLFELGIKDILAKHNEYRFTVEALDPAVNRVAPLKAIKARDLEMVVVDVFKVNKR